MFTIKATRTAYGQPVHIMYSGVFTDPDAARGTAARIENSGLLDPVVGLEVVPIPHDITPGPIADEFLA